MDRAAAPGPCNCFAIRRAARHVSQLYDGHLAPSGLKTSQFSVLVRLSKAGPLAIGGIMLIVLSGLAVVTLDGWRRRSEPVG